MPQPPGKVPSKIAQLRSAMRAGNWELALRLAARFPRLGDDKKAILRAHEAYSNPSFYQQLGLDPEALKTQGMRALLMRYGKQSEHKPSPRIVLIK